MPRSSPPSRNTPSFPVSQPPPTVFRNPYSSVGQPTPNIPSPSFGQSMKDGFGLGVGSAIAQRVVGGILGAPTVNVVNKAPQKQEHPCEKELLAFESCIKTQSTETFCGIEQSALVQCIQISGPIRQSHQ